MHLNFVHVVALAAVILGGCTVSYDWEFDRDDIAALTPGTTQVPLNMGVHYTPNFRTHTSKHRMGFEHVAQIGPSSVKLFDNLLAGMFTSVTTVEVPPPYDCNVKGVDLLLVFDRSFSSFHFRGMAPGADDNRATITFLTTVYLPSGDRMASWSSSGSGISRGFSTVFSKVQEMIDLALRDAARNFSIDLREALATSEVKITPAGKMVCA